MSQEVVKNILNVSTYRFVRMTDARLQVLRIGMKEHAVSLDLKGTILLSKEGINLYLAGSLKSIESYKQFLEAHPEFNGLFYKESYSDRQPFRRMLVKIKKELISMGREEVVPEEKTAPHLSPEDFKKWYEEGRDMIVLDTRNDYEVALGTFENAVDFGIESFREFPEAVAGLPEDARKKPIVTFCTGGIRCEKAAEYMLQQGYENVYQLDGGILNYFEKEGGAHWDGECFVFDYRVAVNAQLEETSTVQCFACRNPLTVDQQKQGEVCPYCSHLSTVRKSAQQALA